MSDAADQRFAPPQAHVADLAPEQTVLAGRGVRFVAALIDGLIAACLIAVILMVPALQSMLEAEESAGGIALKPLSTVVGLVVFLLLQGWPLLTRGQTLGKMMFKLRIVRTDGSKPDAFRLLGLRYGIGLVMSLNVIAVMVYSLIDSLLIFRESRQCLHDSIADTQVIKL
ncbi:RDD family protein [Roseateles asaccharophilus]|uniref:RDD family membrane protein YckC n=1 Tax=Roseateles asaccharophilus TaxID=582607 RepID=A0ABU2AFF5_9BURK|nr:RDD family protein [Roseateles asaccharophilus]MDR7335705.1 putative RDD family membrane protein YckC [Roseateles asaccharophilus]